MWDAMERGNQERFEAERQQQDAKLKIEADRLAWEKSLTKEKNEIELKRLELEEKRLALEREKQEHQFALEKARQDREGDMTKALLALLGREWEHSK